MGRTYTAEAGLSRFSTLEIVKIIASDKKITHNRRGYLVNIRLIGIHTIQCIVVKCIRKIDLPLTLNKKPAIIEVSGTFSDSSRGIGCHLFGAVGKDDHGSHHSKDRNDHCHRYDYCLSIALFHALFLLSLLCRFDDILFHR